MKPDTPVPDLLLEQYRLGELPERDARALGAQVASDESLQARLLRLDRSDDDIRRLHGRSRLADGVRRALASPARIAPARPQRLPAWTWPAGLAAAAAALALTLQGPMNAPASRPNAGAAPAEPGRIKGPGPTLSLFRKTAGGSEALADGDVARTGDLVRVGYRSAGRRHGVILSVDDRRAVTVHLAGAGGRSAALGAAGVVLLDHAYELDDAPGFERFFFVTADAPFAVAPVVDAARTAAASGKASSTLRLSPSLSQSSFLLEKGR